MAVDAALDIFPQIQFLVLDKLQVVSYKWLGRHFSISSNHAKRLLQEFAEKYHNELDVIYKVSGRLKGVPQVYHFKLASNLQLSEAKKEFQDGCSVQIYSIQACIPNDLSLIHNAECIQTEELFNQPPTEENCLWGNRFCAVSNPFVKCIVDGKHVDILPKQTSVMGVAVGSKSKNTEDLKPVQPDCQGLAGKSISQIGVQTPDAGTGVKSDKIALEDVRKATKPPVHKEDVSVGNDNKRKATSGNPSSGNTGSLSSFWNRASEKSKPLSSAAETTDSVPAAAGTAEADAFGVEDDDHDINCKRESNGHNARKRRVVLDFSDEDDEENVVSPASPDLPVGENAKDSTCASESPSIEGKILNSEEQKVNILNDLQENMEQKDALFSSVDASSSGSKEKFTSASLSKKIGGGTAGVDKGREEQSTNSSSNSPKRKKVLKTRVDNRGREVTEVVWEGEFADADKTEKSTVSNNASNRPSMVDKTQAPISSVPANQANKGGNKKPVKGGPKDPKQGNILSFFKRA